jgi:hypothetical protein
LLPKGQVFEDEIFMSAAGRADRACDQQHQFEHDAIVSSVVRRINRVG